MKPRENFAGASWDSVRLAFVLLSVSSSGAALNAQSTHGAFPSAIRAADGQAAASQVLGGLVTGTLATGEYEVTSDLVVPSGETLIIEPGTKLFFGSGLKLQVLGSLVADSKSAAPIVFTSANATPQPGDWLLPAL